MKKRMSPGMIVLVAMCLPVAWAAKAPLSPAKKQQESSHIVIGTVKQIESKDVRRFNTGGNGFGSVNTYHGLAVQIEQVMKGEGIKPGDSVLLKCWEAKRGGWFGTIWDAGVDAIPEKGARRVFYFNARQNEGKTEYWIIHPNGIDDPPQNIEEQ